MAKRSSKASKRKSQNRKSNAVTNVVVTTTHKLIGSTTEALEFLAALAKAPAGVQLIRRLRSDDGSNEICVWDAPSLKIMVLYFERHFPKAQINGTIGHFITLPPLITRVLADVTPTSGVIVGGLRFGSFQALKSKLLLVGSIGQMQKGAFPSPLIFDGMPAVAIGTTDDDIQWGNTFAAGTIPAMTGVLDQPATLVIVRAQDGKASNSWPVTFRATRAVLPIPGYAFNVVTCAGDSCSTSSSWSIAGVANGFPLLSTANSGTDTYSCQLQNQFIYDHYEWIIQDGINGGPFGGNPDPIFQSRIDLEISWFYDFGIATSSLYALNVYAYGPVGLTGW